MTEIERANDIARAIASKVDYLALRWEDEKEYEPWKDYDTALREPVEKLGGIMVTATKRPFGVSFCISKEKPRRRFRVIAKGNKIVFSSHQEAT